MSANGANAYETARAENIRRNQALLAELNLQATRNPSNGRSTTQTTSAPAAKKRKTKETTVTPSRVSARLAASDRPRPTYNEDAAARTPSEKSSAPQARPYGSKQRRRTNAARTAQAGGEGAGRGESEIEEDGGATASVPASSVEEIVAGWSAWTPTAASPTRDGEGTFHFEDEPTFLPNKSPAEMLREGAFGGSYYRPLRTRKLGIVVEGDWEEIPENWIEGLDISRFLTSSSYDPDVNKYKVSCGQSIEDWEAAGWINHDFDVRGWFQWYTRFFRGRRCEDDDRQISRWRKCVGETGRWRRTLLKKYMQLGVRTVWDDGEDEDAPEVSPVIHQTCHHWAWEVRQEVLDSLWA